MHPLDKPTIKLPRKRILLPLLMATLLVASIIVSLVKSNTSTIVIYNQTDAALLPLRVTACGQTRVFNSIDEKNSVRFRLETSGSESEIELELAAEPAWLWKGGYVAPQGGHRITIRLYPGGHVELDTQRSIWQRLFKGE